MQPRSILLLGLTAALPLVAAAPHVNPQAVAAAITPAPTPTLIPRGNGCAIQSNKDYVPQTWCECFPGGNALTIFPAVSGQCPYGPSSFPTNSAVNPTLKTTASAPKHTGCSVITSVCLGHSLFVISLRKPEQLLQPQALLQGLALALRLSAPVAMERWQVSI